MNFETFMDSNEFCQFWWEDFFWESIVLYTIRYFANKLSEFETFLLSELIEIYNILRIKTIVVQFLKPTTLLFISLLNLDALEKITLANEPKINFHPEIELLNSKSDISTDEG